MEKKNVCYTIITGGYDELMDPKVITPNWKYVCFTDNPDVISSSTWEVRSIPSEILNDDTLNDIKKQRVLKINPYKYIKDEDLSLSVYVDANLEINCNLDELSEKYKDSDIIVPIHPQRNCIYKEAKIILALRKDKNENINPQLKFLEEEKFPHNFHLNETNVLIRRQTEKIEEMMNLWEDTLRKYSHRDQMSFNYAEWKTNAKVTDLPKNENRKKLFLWRKHGTKTTISKQLRVRITSIKTAKPIHTPPLTTKRKVIIGRLSKRPL